MNFNVNNVTQSSMSTSEVPEREKSYFVHPARATISTRCFLYLGCQQEIVAIVLPAAVPVVVAHVLRRPVPDVDNVLTVTYFHTNAN